MALIIYASHFCIFQILLLLSPTTAGKASFIKLPLLHKNPYSLTPSEALYANKSRLCTLFSIPKLPVNSAASFGSGQYLIRLHIGAPPQRLSVAVSPNLGRVLRARASTELMEYWAWAEGPFRSLLIWAVRSGSRSLTVYCMRTPMPASYLLIGGSQPTAKLNYTTLLTNPLSSTFYYISIQNVRINNMNLRISPSVWAIDKLGNGGTILDSGTTLTYVAKPAYQSIVAEFKRLVKLPRAAEPLGFDLCLNVSSGLMPNLPRLSFKLEGGSIFLPSPSNYFIDTADGVKCLALKPVSSPNVSSVIENLMQQGFTFEFDKDRSRLGFSRHGCSVVTCTEP